MTVSEPAAKWCCNGDPERADMPVGDRGHAPTCRYHESNYAPSNPPPTRAEPSRGAPDARKCLTCFAPYTDDFQATCFEGRNHVWGIVPREPDAFEAAWLDYNKRGVAGGWEKVAFVGGFGRGFKAGRESGHVVLLEALRRLIEKANLFSVCVFCDTEEPGTHVPLCPLAAAEAAIEQAERT